jgi:hypothetical protein
VVAIFLIVDVARGKVQLGTRVLVHHCFAWREELYLAIFIHYQI